MKCNFHENVDASFSCLECGTKICRDCAVNNNGQVICVECAQKKGLPIIKNSTLNTESIPNDSQKKYKTNSNSIGGRKISTFWATILSFIPGAGHMYIGVMKRGLQIMLGFFGIIAISGIIYGAGFLGILSVIIWFYGVFDCYHIRRKLQKGETVEEDLIIDIDLKKINFYHIGIALVAFGGILLINETFSQMLYMSNDFFINPNIIRFFRNMTFPALLIVGGVFILRRAKKNLES